jgi:hypothetical protein
MTQVFIGSGCITTDSWIVLKILLSPPVWQLLLESLMLSEPFLEVIFLILLLVIFTCRWRFLLYLILSVIVFVPLLKLLAWVKIVWCVKLKFSRHLNIIISCSASRIRTTKVTRIAVSGSGHILALPSGTREVLGYIWQWTLLLSCLFLDWVLLMGSFLDWIWMLCQRIRCDLRGISLGILWITWLLHFLEYFNEISFHLSITSRSYRALNIFLLFLMR